MLDQISPKRPLLEGGKSMSGTDSSLNEADKSVSKNDSKTSSARTTIRNLRRRVIRVQHQRIKMTMSYVARFRYGVFDPACGVVDSLSGFSSLFS
jgi:hypothetical protein